MEKNAFLLYNDIVSSLYLCGKEEELRTQFLPRLKLLIPYSYASIFLADPGSPNQNSGTPALRPAMCVPASFADAENKWRDTQNQDHLSWLTMSRESILVRESEILSDEQRLNSWLYKHCYRKYNIFDTLQYAIINEGRCLGIITLFRTRIDDEFSDDDAFFLRSMGIHLTTVLKRYTFPDADTGRPSSESLKQTASEYGLTAREMQIYGMILSFCDNIQICESLGIKENTLQKHLQNLFRKMEVSSRWEAAARYYRADRYRER